MNIFLSDPCPQICAKNLDDKRVVKMALETAQMLSSSLIVQSHLVPGPSVDIGYGMTHAHHPCSVWTRKNRSNFSWLIEHGLHLCEEYSIRYGDTHASLEVIERAAKHRTMFNNDDPLVFSFNSSGYDTGDVFHDYKLCLVNKWKNLDKKKPNWGYTGRPAFVRQLYPFV